MSANSVQKLSRASLLRREQLLLEQIARNASRQTLAGFIDYSQLGLVPAAHHKLLLTKLEQVERGELERLMILMPPGSAKSTYASVIFPPWFMGRNPQSSVLGVSNTTSLAERFSKRARNLVGHRAYRNTFGFGPNEDAQSAGSWETEAGGEFFAAGVGSAIAGRRADLGLIDDPIKSREEADSEGVRDKQWDWYINDFRTRLKPGARQILIMTRWHEDDLGGRLLDREADRWHVVKIPMMAGVDDPIGRKPGERLWPEWFTDQMVSDAKADTRAWNALYQQEPAPDEGDYFQRDWFREFDIRPGSLRIYGASDYAVSDGGGDFTEHAIVGVDSQNDLYVLDWWRGQTTSDVWIERQCDLIAQHSPLVWYGEGGPIRRSIEPFLKRRMQERQTYCQLEWLASISDKVIRARPFQARAAMEKVWFPKHADWKSDVIGQLTRFPGGKYDDAVDTLSLIGRALEFVKGPPQTMRAPPPMTSRPTGWMG